MTIQRCVAMGVLGAAGAFVLGAQPAPQKSALEEIGWLVGGTWVSESKAAGGSPATIEVTYEWTEHKKAIQYSIVRRTRNGVMPAVTGLCGWHPGKKQLVLWEVDYAGHVTESLLVVQGNKLSFNEIIYEAGGATVAVRAEGIREKDDFWIFKASVPRGGEWQVVFEARFKRVWWARSIHPPATP